MYWLDHIGIVVDDLKATIYFYSRLFGTQIVDRAEWRGRNADYVADMIGRPHGLELEAAFFQIPHTNTLLELLDWSGIDQDVALVDPTSIGATHFAFYVDDLDSALTHELRSALIGTPQQIPFGPSKGGKAAQLRDPNGVSLQLIELVKRPGGLPVQPRASFWLDHVGVAVRDLGASIDFYSQLLGEKIIDRADWRGRSADYIAEIMGREHGLELEAAYFKIPHTNTLLELLQWRGIDQHVAEVDPTAIGATHFALYVDSLEMAIKGPLGSALSGPPQDIPYGPCEGGRAAYLKEPNGANLQLMQLVKRPGGLPVQPSARQAVR